MRILLGALLALCVAASAAAAPQPKPAIPTGIAFTQGTITRTLNVPKNASCTDFRGTNVNGQHGLSRFRLICGNTSQQSYVQFSADAGPIYAQWLWPAPVCGQKPAVASQHADCAAPLVGPGWTQTHDWTCVAGVWQALPWVPADPPAGACHEDTPPPPSGDIDLSYVDKSSPAYATFKSWVNGCLSNNSCYQFLPLDAAFMAKLDGGPQYCAKAISDADRYASRVEASIAAGGQPNFTGDPQGMDGLSGDSYLAVGPRVRDLAIVQKWCPTVTASQKQRWTAIIAQAVFNVWHPTQATWGGRSFPWSGWTVTPPDPGDNYYYSFTLATQMYEWITGDLQYHSRTWPVLQAYFATLPTGGSEEGSGYGTSHKTLFEIIRWQRDIFGENYVDDHLSNSAAWWAFCIMPNGINFCADGDQSRTNPPAVTDYQRALLAQIVATTTDANAEALAAYTLHHVTPSSMTSTYDYRDGLLPTGPTNAPAPSSLCYFGQSTGDLFCRTGWDSGALWAGFRAGKYDQSHAHQDQGAFQLFYGGNWLVVDQSVWSHSGIEQDPTNNSTLAFYRNGTLSRQVYNSASSMTVTGTDPATGVHAVANLQPAAGAAASAWTRTLDFVGRTVTVADTFTAASGYTAVWQLQVPVQPTVSGNVITAGAFKATVLAPANPTITVVAMSSVNSDYVQGWRVEVRGGIGSYLVNLETQ